MSVKTLRELIVDHKNNIRRPEPMLKVLQERQASMLEVLRLPPYHGSVLSLLKALANLRYLTITYVDILTSWYSRRKSDTNFDLARYLPDGVRFLEILTGQTGAFCLGMLPPTRKRIGRFLQIMHSHVRNRCIPPVEVTASKTKGCLSDICLHELSSMFDPEQSVLSRVRFRKIISNLDTLIELCRSSGANLHLDSSENGKRCKNLHPFRLYEAPSKDELQARATKLGKGADTGVQAQLAEYMSRLEE